jgi:DNA end-binding protein Ku
LATPGRPYCKGFLLLSLVTISVNVYNAAESAAEIRFNQIHKPSKKRIRYEKVVPGIGPVENSDIVKGYLVDQDTYVVLEPEELEAIRLESKKVIELSQFVDTDEIDPRYYERPFYIVPADDLAAEGYFVIRKALEQSRKAAIGQITMHGREHLVAVSPVENGLLMEIIRYKNELRSASTFFDDLPTPKIDRELIDMANQLITRKSAPFKPESYHDSYAVALKELVAKKAKGKKIVTTPEDEAPVSNVIDLMQALKGSLKNQPEREREATRETPRKTPAKRRAAR